MAGYYFFLSYARLDRSTEKPGAIEQFEHLRPVVGGTSRKASKSSSASSSSAATFGSGLRR